MTRFILAAAALAGTSGAGAQEINHQARLGQAVARGCTVQQVHTPAGKMVHNAPIVTCPERTMARVARAGDARRAIEKAPTELARR